MPPLRAHRRDRRARAAKVRKRRNLTKFVPSSDSDFAMTARAFAERVSAERKALGISDHDAEHLRTLVNRYRDALAVATNPGKRTKVTIAHKNDARKEAEKWVRRIGSKIRTDPSVERSHKVNLRLVDLSPRKKTSECPHRPPVLRFVGSGDGVDGGLGEGNGSGVHVLIFRDKQDDMTKQDFGVVRRARSDGATRIELWVGFIPQEAAVPQTPQEYCQRGFGWPLYLRSFDASPIEARFPMPDRPMLIVYWARWANNRGEYGRFCKTCIACVEGWSAAPAAHGRLPERAPGSQVSVEHGAQHALPAGKVQMIEAQRTQTTFMLVGTPLAMPVSEGDADGSVLFDEQRKMLDAVSGGGG